MPCDHIRSVRKLVLKLVFKTVNGLALFTNAQGHMTSTCPGARQLGVGVPITILQFAPLARLHPVLGFHAIYCVCARFIRQGCVL
jgi:hypothetical protein